MLTEFDRLTEGQPEKRRRDITRIVYELMRRQFIYSADRGFAGIFNVLMEPRVRSFVADYFGIGGFDFMLNEQEGWAGIIPVVDPETENGGWHQRMTLGETLVLLTVAQMWQNEANRGELGPNATVTTTLTQVLDLYETLIPGKTRSLKSSGFETILKTQMQRRGLVHLTPSEGGDGEFDFEVEIRPHVIQLVGNNVLEQIERYGRLEDGRKTVLVPVLADEVPEEEE
jgi:hypothetical protein